MKSKIKKIIEDEIVSIELVGEMDTIDITVEDTHMFFANDIYTHNSAINESKFDLKVISESLGKAQTADVILGLGRSDEDKAARRAFLLCLKNRNGEDGFSEELYFDTSNIDIYLSKGESNIGFAGIGDSISSIENTLRANKKIQIKPEDEVEDIDDAY